MIKKLQTSGVALIIFLSAIIVVIFFMGLYYYNIQRDEIKNEKYAELSTIATLKTNQLVDYRKERLNEAKVILSDEFFTAELIKWITNPENEHLENTISNYLEEVSNIYGYEDILIIDSTEKVYLAVGFDSTSKEETTYIFLDESMNKKTILISNIYYCDKSAKFHLDVFVPILIDEKLIGGMIFRIDPQQFLYPLIQSLPTLSTTAESMLVSEEGNEVVYLNKFRHNENTVLNLRVKIDSGNINMPAVAATYGINGLVEGVDYRGVPVLSDIRKIPDSPWWVIVKVDLTEVYSKTREQAIYIGCVVGLLILFFASGFFWLWKNQRKSVNMLDAQTKLELQTKELASRKKIEEALRIKNWVFDVSIAASCIADINGNITEVNRSFLHLWSYPDKKEVLGMPLMAFIQNLEEEKEEIIEVLNDKGNWEGRFTAKKRDGSTFTAQCLATILNDENGNGIGYQSMIVDMTRRIQMEDEIKRLNLELEKRVEERTLELEGSQAALLNIVEDLNEKSLDLEISKAKLEDSNKELESFSYSVSHDLRAPLRALDGFAHILLENYKPVLDSEGKRYLDIISENAINMGKLIDDLLAFSRLSRQEIQLSKINMYELAKSVFKELKPQATLTKIEFNIALISEAYGDPSMIKQVWRNLIGNAIKYGKKKEKLIIEIGNTKIDNEIVYFIKDNGVGFDMAYADKLFGVFQRLHSQNDFEGTGVGLAIVQRIIRRLGGRVWAEAEVDKGATFYFTLKNKVN